MGKSEQRKMRRIVILMAGMSLLLAIYLTSYLRGERGNKSLEGVQRVAIEPGASTRDVAYLLKENDLIRNPRRFVMHTRWRRIGQKMKAGTYDFPRSASMSQLANIIVDNLEVMVDITIPEGYMARQIASVLDSASVCDSAAFMQNVQNSELTLLLGIEGTNLEGFLFPETYKFKLNQDPKTIIWEMANTFRKKVGSEWMQRTVGHPNGLLGVVTLASIIQGEFQLPGEADDIAAVYHNRLKAGWKLQADPTIQFIIPGEPRRLFHGDLRINSPYNTYRNYGLPPGPINNPGIEALMAALNPPKKTWMFMVARGDGGHTFSVTLKEHLQAKKRLDAIRRQASRRQHEMENAK